MGSEVKPGRAEEFDAWFDSVLRLNQRPAWLVGEVPDSDVVVSSRARLMRNLIGLPFPHKCSRAQLELVQFAAMEALGATMRERERISEAERALLVGSRLVSPDFPWNEPGRSVFVDPEKSASVMVNEEDHFRLQAVCGGLQIEEAWQHARVVERTLQERLVFAIHPTHGYLAASLANAGEGRRLGVMLHLPALAFERVTAVAPEGFELRGFMGEVTGGLGAFVQLSTTSLGPWELLEAARHLMLQERKARHGIDESKLDEQVEGSRDRMLKENGLNLWEATNQLSWLRLAAARGKIDRSPRELDALLSLLTLGPHDEPLTNLRRTRLMRRFLELTLPWAAS